MPDLSKLADPKVREALLLAEVAAWLHDWQKCIDMAVASHWRESPHVDPQKTKKWQRRGSKWQPGQFSQVLESHTVGACEDNINFKVLAEEGSNPKGKGVKSAHYLSRTLAQAHSVGHAEKELEEGEARKLATDWLSSPFGHEPKSPEGFLQILLEEIKPDLEQRLQGKKEHRDFLEGLGGLFKDAWGDTRRPINEVTLWDWSSIVAALYKAELARCVLTGEKRRSSRVAWRLLSIRTNGLEYLLSASSIPDLRARQEILKDAWNKVRTLLEETYPLGLEVYRDENGPVFVVPDIQNLDLIQDSTSGKTLPQQILEQFAQGTVQDDPELAIHGELVPDIYLDPQSWKGQPAPQELPPIGKNWKDPSRKGHLERDVETVPGPESVANWWSGSDSEICTVCRLRPQGPSQKAKDRNVCDTCEQRRADRSKEWALTKLHTTIWTDEVADVNGRLALIVGQFNLEHWLSGDLVRTLAVREPNDQNGRTHEKVAKNPSFARLRRIWETTRTFWQEVLPTDEDRDIAQSLVAGVIHSTGPRLEIKDQPHPLSERLDGTPGTYHTYELVLPRRVKLSVVWDKENQRFITCDNLDYLAGEGQLSRPVEDVLKQGSVFNIEEPVGYGARNKEWGMITLTQDAAEIPDSAYIPAIPILAEPRTFMALVPADKALDVVRAIKTKYEREMGKVRNRLPLHLGVVYAHRRMPLRAVLDAARRMLEQAVAPEGWTVKNVRKQPDSGGTLPERLSDDAQGQFAKWYEIVLRRDGKEVTWYIPALMSDGKTEDCWYPYVFLKTNAEPSDRQRRFQAPNPWTGQDDWLVHVGELKEDDVVYFTPSTFDFQWLDSAAQRFEIAYDRQGCRHGSLSRPYLLDEVDDLVRCWDVLSQGLHSTQIHALREDIEAKREAWFTDPRASREDKAFEAFCCQRLVNAEWREGRPETMDSLVQWAVGGLLTDAIELFHHIMKRKPEAEEKETGGARL